MANKTPSQKVRHYKRLSHGLFAGEFVTTLSPYVVVALVNYDKYFVQYNGTKMTLASFIALAVMGIAVYLVSKKKLENSFITLIVGWAAVMGVFFLLGEIINDIAYIMLYGLIGLIGTYGLDIGSKQASKKAQEIQKGIDRAKEELYAEEYKAEVEAKKVKIKIKKDN